MAFDRLKKIFGGNRDEGGIPGATMTSTGLEATVSATPSGLEQAPSPPSIPSDAAPPSPGQPAVTSSGDATFSTVSVEGGELPEGFDLSGIMKVAMDAAQHGGSGNVVDLRGTPEGQEIRDQLKAAGLDVEGHAGAVQWGPQDAQKFQHQIFDSLKSQGYDIQAMMAQAQQMMGQAGAIPGTAQPAIGQPAAGEPVDDQLEQLEKLGELKAQGVLTDEEFAEQKRKILGE
jgi:hypothetical protein